MSTKSYYLLYSMLILFICCSSSSNEPGDTTQPQPNTPSVVTISQKSYLLMATAITSKEFAMVVMVFLITKMIFP